MAEEKKEDVKNRILVVPELPSQQVTQAKLETGETADLLTISEALTQIYEDIQEIKKAVA